MNQDEYRTYSGENVRNIFSRQSRGHREHRALTKVYLSILCVLCGIFLIFDSFILKNKAMNLIMLIKEEQ